MAVTKNELLSALSDLVNPLDTFVKNARPSRSGKRVLNRRHRIYNEDEEDDSIPELEGFGDEEDFGDEDFGDEGDFDAEEVEDTQAEVGDTVVIQPQQPITGEIVEVVDEEDEEAEEEAPADEEEPVQNARRRYRRVKNARVVRKADGTCDVLEPVENRRRYRTRSVTRNTKVAGCDFDNASTENGYSSLKNIVKTDNARSILRKAKAYDRMVLKNALDQTITDAVGKIVDEKLKKGLGGACTGGSCQNSRRVRNARSKMLRFKNYRHVVNEDGSVAIEINIDDAEPAVDAVAPVVPEIVEPVDLTVDGREIPVDNARIRRIRNFRRKLAKRGLSVMNSASDDGVLDAPSTFPTQVEK